MVIFMASFGRFLGIFVYFFLVSIFGVVELLFKFFFGESLVIFKISSSKSCFVNICCVSAYTVSEPSESVTIADEAWVSISFCTCYDCCCVVVIGCQRLVMFPGPHQNR